LLFLHRGSTAVATPREVGRAFPIEASRTPVEMLSSRRHLGALWGFTPRLRYCGDAQKVNTSAASFPAPSTRKTKICAQPSL